MLVFDKHFDSTHLPFDRQVWNSVFDGLSSFDTKTAEFCRGCFFWSDGREKDIDSVFDFYETMRQDWINQQFNETLKPLPLPLPQLTVLIEGIDGSGKDTFAKFLFESLTRLFHRKNGGSVSIVGLPSSAIEFGQDCRRFIEEGSASIPACEMGSMLKSNRCRSLDRFKADHPGIQILIRGEWTERATMERVYGIHEEPGPCEGVDMVIFVKTRPIIARKRVESRGTRITWRETLPELEFFNDFYWNSFLRTQDAFLVENDVDSMDNLRVQAIQLAHVIYRRISALGT